MTDPKITGTSTASQSTQVQKTDTAGGKLTQNSKLGQQEFLQLLVTQLQNQDPLNPMSNEDFAVQLAQFSSLEQLIDINKKMDGSSSGAGSVASLASFLGNEVVLSEDAVQITGGKGNNIMFDIPAGTQSGRIDLKNDQGVVVGSMELTDITPGKKKLAMEGLNVPDGAYTVRAVSVNSEGRFVDMKTKITGTVEGFVMEPEQALIIGGEQVPLSSVKEVLAG